MSLSTDSSSSLTSGVTRAAACASKSLGRWRFAPGTLLLLCLVPLSAHALSAAPGVLNPGVLNPDGGGAGQADAQASGFGPLDPSLPKGVAPEQIIAKFGQRETAFKEARNQYTFRESVKVQTISDTSGQPDGTYQQVTDIVLTEDGRPAEHVVFAPQNTLERVTMSQADFDDIAHRLPFVLTTSELPEYTLTYLGQQKVDDLQTYVFDCRPKVLEKGKRYFQGKIWVDQLENEIVLITGKNVPDDVNPKHADLSPPFSTYYEEIDGVNWFPVYTKGEGLLHFPPQNGALAEDVHMRYVVRYENYKRFHAKSRIIYNGQDLPPAAPPPSAQPAPAQSQPNSTPAVSPTPNLPPPDPDAPKIKPKGRG